MSRIIFVPQYPTPNRYQEWWLWKFREEFRRSGFEVVTLGNQYIDLMIRRRGDASNFSPVNDSIELESRQIAEYMTMKIDKSDILFLSDISFPGLFCSALYHKRPKRMFAFCHATSINTLDYFSDTMHSKFSVETAHSLLFEKVFVGSQYHKDKLAWKNTEVTYLPFPPLKFFRGHKKYDIVSASRPSKQKVDFELEAEVEKMFGKITRKETNSWGDYYSFLSTSKVLLITSHEDTFGYQIVDSILNGCIPIARNSFAYPEILSREYLYSNKEELFHVLEKALNGKLPLPKILCEKQMDNFFGNIITEMKG